MDTVKPIINFISYAPLDKYSRIGKSFEILFSVTDNNYYSAYNNVGIGCAGLESRLGWKPMWVIYCYHFMVQHYVSVLLYLLKTDNIKSIYITVLIIII